MVVQVYSVIALILWMGGAIDAVNKELLGTKTMYDSVTQVGFEPFQANDDMRIEHEGRTCTAIHVSMLLRHGSRNPGADDVEDVEKMVKRIKDNKGSAGPLDFIDTWTSDMKPEDGDMLNNVGQEEMLDIGTRIGTRFQELLVNKQSRLEFIASSRARTIDSGKFFSRGLSRYLYSTDDMTTPSQNDKLLRINDNCDYFENTVDDNDKLMEERDKFLESAAFKDMVSRIEDRLKLNADTHLSADDVEYIWEMCGFELMAGRENTWCSMMSDEDRRVASFAKDLEDYYEDSYGNEEVSEGAFGNGVSGEIHCVVVKKFFELMDAAIAGHKSGSSDYKIGSFMFGHSSTVMGTATTLELFKDKLPLRATDLDKPRKFVAAKISPMAGNIGYALYACPGQSNTDTRYAVRLFHNERDRPLSPFLSHVYSYDQYKAAFKNTAKCNIDALCKYPRDSSGAGAVGASAFALMAVSVFYYYL